MNRADKIISEADALAVEIGDWMSAPYFKRVVRQLCAELEIDGLPHAIRAASNVSPQQAKALIDSVADLLYGQAQDFSESVDGLQECAAAAAEVFAQGPDEAAVARADLAREIERDDERRAA